MWSEGWRVGKAFEQDCKLSSLLVFGINLLWHLIQCQKKGKKGGSQFHKSLKNYTHMPIKKKTFSCKNTLAFSKVCHCSRTVWGNKREYLKYLKAGITHLGVERRPAGRCLSVMVLTTSSTHSNCPQKNNRLNHIMNASLSRSSVTPPPIFTAMSFTVTRDPEPNHFDMMIFAYILQIVRLKKSTMAPLFCLSPSICLCSTVCCIQLHFIASANPTFSYHDFAAKTVMKHSLFEPLLLWKSCRTTAHNLGAKNLYC